MTRNQRLYQQQVTRLRRNSYYWRRQGYLIDLDLIPARPQRITRQFLERLSNIRPRDLIYTGETVSDSARFLGVGGEITGAQINEQYRQPEPERFEDAEEVPLPDYSEVIIANYRREIARFPGPIYEMVIGGWLNPLIHEQGIDNVAKMIEDSPEKLKEYLNRVAYGDSASAVADYTANMLNYMPDMTESRKRDLQEAFETYGSFYETV